MPTVHHDFALPAFPLAVEWMDCPPRPLEAGAGAEGVGSFAAVATFLPGIELWDLDVADAMEPIAELGGYDMTRESSVWLCHVSLCVTICCCHAA